MNKYNINFDTTYLKLPKELYKEINPTPVSNPKVVIYNNSFAEQLGIKDFGDEGNLYLSGNKILEGSTPFAQSYSGHQFGHFTTLGDGRVITLGELAIDSGRFDIQLKGAGRTPYSRGGDGRASLGPMLREYLISEAMHHLGIKSTRSLAVIDSGENIFRQTPESGAILTRIAKAHIRVGSFQHIAANHTLEMMKEYSDYTINRLYPKLMDSDNPYLALLNKLVSVQAYLIAKWQLVGFVHGVMNTDNMAISGETIDYGPCAFMDTYKLETVFSSIDHQGRYAYGNQPYIAKWNLTRFAETLLPLIAPDSNRALNIAQESLDKFPILFTKYLREGIGKKLGIPDVHEEDQLLFNELFKIMTEENLDFTQTFARMPLNDFKSDNNRLSIWLTLLRKRHDIEKISKHEAISLMIKHNPIIIPRNHWVELALNNAVRGDMKLFNQLNDTLKNPFDLKHYDSKFYDIPKTKKPYVTYCGT